VIFTDYFKQRLSAFLLLASCIAGCAADSTTLNSERIARMFGNYSIEVLENKNNIRVSNLHSQGIAGPVCRTFAVVRLPEQVESAFEAEHTLITRGASIGSVFKNHGWDISKHHRYIGDIELDSTSQRVARLMQIETPASAAIHVYVFAITRSGRTFDYATIAEVHHPEYLTSAELRSIYGNEFSGEDKLDEMRQVIELIMDKFRDPAP